MTTMPSKRQIEVSESPQLDPMLEEGPVSPAKKAVIIGGALLVVGMLFFSMTREAPEQVANTPAAQAPAASGPAAATPPRETTGQATPSQSK